MSWQRQQPPIRSLASAYEDHEAVALVGHCTHIVAQPRKLIADLSAQIRLVIGVLPRCRVMITKQPFHILRLENAAELARLRLAVQASGSKIIQALATQEQIAQRTRGAHIPDRHKVHQAPRGFEAQCTFERSQGCDRTLRLSLACGCLLPGGALPEAGLARLQLRSALRRSVLEHVKE